MLTSFSFLRPRILSFVHSQRRSTVRLEFHTSVMLLDIHSPQIPEFVSFDERLENSLQRDVVKVEHVRMRMTHEPINSDLIDMELIELKFVFDRCKLHRFHTYTSIDPVLSPP